MALSTCLIGEMRYVECFCHSDVWFVDYNGLPIQPDTNWPARVINAYSSYWCVTCDELFMTWGDAVEHLFPGEHLFPDAD